MNITHQLGTLVAAAALTAGVVAIAPAPAQAAGDVPLNGELCRAADNIQFYNGAGEASYVVQRNGYIRIDSDRYGRRVQGHGEGHSTREFIWLDANGNSRVYGCSR